MKTCARYTAPSEEVDVALQPNSQTHEGTRIQWYVAHDECNRKCLHIHIYACNLRPLVLHEQRQKEKSLDIPAVSPSQLESYLRLSLGTSYAPLQESGTRDMFHTTYDYTPDFEADLAYMIHELSDSTPHASTKHPRIETCA